MQNVSLQNKIYYSDFQKAFIPRKVYANTLTKLYEIAFQQETINLKLIESEVMALNQSVLTNR